MPCSVQDLGPPASPGLAGSPPASAWVINPGILSATHSARDDVNLEWAVEKVNPWDDSSASSKHGSQLILR
ncbi:hypothetical protein PAAG_06066 [Paracoccidioides lutzii Pb01]|uniref:Uncharacterized protein n=1 Tax=Paracoccidioides lutzii (strain ATCC MYA-826 / Pb01) TaxID=502779 RepID=C1H5V6_PARBA|nr:hypothetical protein PAAG_06066 [Paracoccidioides lutzii Pb01]EEH35019.2 hypothetical protein PAAG_06066 [Paracoccidioides lutzii Pb01]